MNWISNVVRPKFGFFNKRETPENLWVKDPDSGELVFHRDLEQNQMVVPNSGYHMKIRARERYKFFFDNGEWTQISTPEVAVDPLKFRDSKRYVDRLRDAKATSGEVDTIIVGQGKVKGVELVAAVQDPAFILGSLGMAAGEAIVTGMLHAVEKHLPFVIFTASGGARMQEGILSLMQMPRTTIAVQKLRDAGLPFIVVLTDPTTGGVTASYAMLGDVHISEPGALIGFAGQRVIQQTIREKLPEGFQRAEYLKEHGMVDMVVHRHDLPNVIANLCSMFMKQDRPDFGTPPVLEEEILEAPADDDTSVDGEAAGSAQASDKSAQD